MIIGVPKEIKNNENRVGLTPAGVTAFKTSGHEVWVESSAGMGSGFPDEAYEAAGAKIVQTAEAAWAAEMVIKVKEPLAEEYGYFHEGLIRIHLSSLSPRARINKGISG